MNLHITTPFGRRPLTAAQVRAQANAAACPSETAINKWAVFRHIAQAKDLIGVSDRSLAVLNALLTFHPETALVAGPGDDLVVFPSNEQLALRAHGMAETTLRRHLAALVETGLVIRRDSPNGKRYVRKGQGGVVVQAFGFDLTPLVARADEFERLAEKVQSERRYLQRARETVTLLRRDAIKLIAAGEGEGLEADWESLRRRYATVVCGLGRLPSPVDLDAAAGALRQLVTDLGNILTTHQKTQETDGNADHSERHKHNSKPESSDSEHASDLERSGEGSVPLRPDRSPAAAYPLGMVLSACPDIQDYARNGIHSWRELTNVADLVRSILGISASAWREAQVVMGSEMAAATLAAILQRAEHIKSPGGYMRTLVDRKRAGQFSLGPVLLALTRAKVGKT
ncbi:plasmid replication protein RepC [Methylobacterium oxalidis]|uniref:plasmid replication protein RepC n=1 Tax=Methylobacterium oxalidis TaxID=944322 RepID=UPI0033159AAD